MLLNVENMKFILSIYYFRLRSYNCTNATCGVFAGFSVLRILHVIAVLTIRKAWLETQKNIGFKPEALSRAVAGKNIPHR